jgi:hypothetical protein
MHLLIHFKFGFKPLHNGIFCLPGWIDIPRECVHLHLLSLYPEQVKKLSATLRDPPVATNAMDH